MPDTDQTSVAARLGALLTALTASPPAVKLVSPTREFVQGLADLSPPWLAVPLRLLKVSKAVSQSACALSRGSVWQGISAVGPAARLQQQPGVVKWLQTHVRNAHSN